MNKEKLSQEEKILLDTVESGEYELALRGRGILSV